MVATAEKHPAVRRVKQFVRGSAASVTVFGDASPGEVVAVRLWNVDQFSNPNMSRCSHAAS